MNAFFRAKLLPRLELTKTFPYSLNIVPAIVYCISLAHREKKESA